MKTEATQPSTSQILALTSLAYSLTTLSAAGAEAGAVDKLIADLQSSDDTVRGTAWQGAGTLGAPAVKPLAALMADSDFEVARSAKRALWKIVRHAGRPKADSELAAVQRELLVLLNGHSALVRQEALWMLSEIGDDGAVDAIAPLLMEVEVREAARCALERLPGAKSVRALKHALQTAPEDFRPALAHSLRVRGQKVQGYPSHKLQPTRRTSVQPKS